MTKGMAAYGDLGGGDPVAPPPNGRQGRGRQGPVARWGAAGPFFSRDLVANLKKKITLKTYRPMGGRPGVFLK